MVITLTFKSFFVGDIVIAESKESTILKKEKAIQHGEASFLLDKKMLSRFSPVQQRILKELAVQPLTLSGLSRKTGCSVYTLGKQLSILQMRTRYNPLTKKGITKPVIKKNKAEGVKTTYFLI